MDRYELGEVYYEVSDSSYLPEGSRFSEVASGEMLNGFSGYFRYMGYGTSVAGYEELFRKELLERGRVSEKTLSFMKVAETDYGFVIEWYVRYEDDGDQYGNYWYVDRIEDCDEVERYSVSIFRVESVDFRDLVSDR